MRAADHLEQPGKAAFEVAAFTRGGGLAQVALAESTLVAPLPGHLEFPLAAAAPLMMTTGLLLLTDVARLQPGERATPAAASPLPCRRWPA